MKSVSSIVASLVLCAGLATPAQAALVLWSPANLMVRAANPLVETYREPGTLPYADSHSVVTDTASSLSVYDFTTSSFRNDFQHTMSAPQSEARFQDQIWFSVTETTNYEISGLYTATRAGNYTGNMSLAAQLHVYAGGPVLFNSHQGWIGGPAGSTFVVGGQDGNDTSLSGSPTGTLQPGTLYVFAYSAGLSGGFETTGGTGAGHVQLIVPEPASLGLLLVAPALLMRRRAPGAKTLWRSIGRAPAGISAWSPWVPR